jgi:hypothetical protein
MMATLPPERRDQRDSGIANALVSTDLDESPSFADSMRGQLEYVTALSAVLRAQARDDAVFAARRMLEVGESLIQDGTAATIASHWASDDPVAAATWAYGLQRETHRASAIGAVASTWAGTDYTQAQSWVFGLEAGPVRDAGLASLLKASAANGSVATGLLAYFSTDRAIQGGMANAVLQLRATGDPEEARRLLERYVTEPRLRQMTERLFESANGQQVPVIRY